MKRCFKMKYYVIKEMYYLQNKKIVNELVYGFY